MRDSHEYEETNLRPRPTRWGLGAARRLASALVALALLQAAGCGADDDPATGDAAAADVAAANDAASEDGTSGDGAASDATAADAAQGSGTAGQACTTDDDCDALDGACGRGSCVGKACVHIVWADGTDCDDNDPCTWGEACSAGVCKGGADACGCTEDADCAPLSKGDLCGGTLACVEKGAPDGTSGLCAVKTGTAVTCPSDDSPCAVQTCDPKTGTCSPKPVVGAPPCNDGNPCTGGTVCADGTCGGGVELCPCTSDKDCVTHQDPKTWRCTGTFYCDLSGDTAACKLDPASVVSCPAGKAGACVAPSCDPADGACTTQALPDQTACDDGNICTGTDLCAKGVCQGEQNICTCTSDADCAQQDDGDACNGTLYCDVLSGSPTCEVLPGSVVDCDLSGDGPCVKTACVPASGACTATQLDNVPCDDGSPCTSGDVCAGGECTPGKSVCACTSDADCAAKNPNNKCLGTLYCDQATKACAVNPSTVVHCPNGGTGPCVDNVCEPKTGQCGLVQRADDTPCDADGNPCTQGDVCAKGACKPGENVCLCDATADCGKFEDGDVCNGALFCDTSKVPTVCEVNPATVVVCPTVDNTACAARTCDPKTGLCPLKAVNALAPCDADGSACTAGDFCLDGTCTAGTNTCACTKDADCAAKEDGDLCNGTLFCDKDTLPFTCAVNPATVVTCNGPFDQCETPVCLPKTGSCTNAAVQDNLACDDGDACTVGEVCKAGACKGGVDLCACKQDSDCAPLNPSDKCLGVYTCRVDKVPHVCEVNPLSVVKCPASGDPCFSWTCNGSTGACDKASQKDGAVCDDGDPCSTKSACVEGTCVGKAKDCADANPCTLDACDAKGVCQHTATPAAPCEDGDACTTGDSCDQSSCKAGPPAVCEDGNPCTNNACDKATGCAFPAKADGALCTTGDGASGACNKGSCDPAP